MHWEEEQQCGSETYCLLPHIALLFEMGEIFKRALTPLTSWNFNGEISVNVRLLSAQRLLINTGNTNEQTCWDTMSVFHKTLLSIASYLSLYKPLLLPWCMLWLSLQVYEILNSAELICLMRYVSIPSTSTAECMVAANQSCKKAGVWIGNGNTEKAQLSFVNLNTDGHTCEVRGKVAI